LKKVFSHLYVQVLTGILLGIAVGCLWPDFGASLKPVGDGFISLIKMLIAPVIFCTVVLGIANAGDLKKAGRIGAKAIVYFEIISTFALVIGLVVANFLKPGEGFNVDPSTLDASMVSEYAQKAKEQSVLQIILHIIPKTFTDAFTGSGDLLQVLLVAVLFGVALSHIGKKGEVVHHFLSSSLEIFFRMVNLVMKLAPLGAGAAMAFTVGKYGLQALAPLAKLMGVFYFTCVLFIFGVLGSVARLAGFNVFKFILYIKNELLLILGTSSSESALVPIMEKLEKLGCSKSVVGLVIPAGYSFNLDGTNIYLTVATLFIAQALNIDLSLGQQLSLILVAMISSKGASGVTGAGFITLAATLAVVPSIPVAALTLIIGVDRFMSEARALTNAIGNGVAAIVISRWENELNQAQLQRELSQDDELPV
jgi:aerobic C4-dicarboxylate transport protein